MLALVPWADSLNHCSTATERSVLQYDHANDSAVLFAHKDYEEGEEVFDSYGTWLTPSELLLDYGFVAGPTKTNAITVRFLTRRATCCSCSVNVPVMPSIRVMQKHFEISSGSRHAGTAASVRNA